MYNIGFLLIFSRSLEHSLFRKGLLLVINLLVSLIGCVVASSVRIATEKQTDTHRPSTVTLAAHARTLRVEYLPTPMKVAIQQYLLNGGQPPEAEERSERLETLVA